MIFALLFRLAFGPTSNQPSAANLTAHSPMAVAFDGGTVAPPASASPRPDVHNAGTAGASPPPTSGTRRGTVTDTPPAPDLLTPESLLQSVSRSPLFALTSGLASILGLLIALYATQVRTIPYSLYRSLMWRKALLMSGGAGLFVFGLIKFCGQEQAPYVSPLREIHAILLGELRVSAVDYQPHGPALWAILGVAGIILVTVGLVYDPPARARTILIREQEALHEAQERQVSALLGGRTVESLSSTDLRVLDDTLDYYRHVQWRFADVVLGAPPPTFALSYRRRQGSGTVEEA